MQVIPENLEKIEYKKKKSFHSSPDLQFARITDHSLFLRKRNTEPACGGFNPRTWEAETGGSL